MTAPGGAGYHAALQDAGVRYGCTRVPPQDFIATRQPAFPTPEYHVVGQAFTHRFIQRCRAIIRQNVQQIRQAVGEKEALRAAPAT